MMLLAPSVLLIAKQKLASAKEILTCRRSKRTVAAKRFKKTGTGKIVYHKAFGSHILSTKSRKRKRP